MCSKSGTGEPEFQFYSNDTKSPLIFNSIQFNSIKLNLYTLIKINNT